MRRVSSNPIVRLLTLTMLLIVLPMAVVSLFMLGVSQRSLLPEMSRKGVVVGQAVAHQVELALAHDIPLDLLVGVDDYLGQILKANPDISYVAVTDGRGKLMYSSGVEAATIDRLLRAEQGPQASGGRARSWLEVLAQLSTSFAGEAELETPRRGDYYDSKADVHKSGETTGAIHVGVSIALLRTQMQDLIFDTAIIFIVSLLIAFEVLLVVVTTGFTAPIQQVTDVLRAGALGNFGRKVGARGAQEIGLLISLLNSVIDNLQQMFAEFATLVAEARRARPERSAQALIDGIVERVYRGVVLGTADAAGRTEVRFTNFRAVNVRTPTFLFIFAEELARPFLPVYVRNVAAAANMPSSDIVISLPLSIFMLVVALAMPTMALWSDRVGRRKSFAIGAIISTVGLLGTALAFSYYDLLFWRALSGLGYATTFVACQGFILDNTTEDNRAKGIALFVGGITAADISGPAIGGMMAERLGFAVTFLFAAVVAFVAAVVALRALHDRRRAKSNAPVRLAHFRTVLSNGRFLSLVLLSAVPAKILLGGVFFFLVPLMMTNLGASQSEIGRLAMTYGVASLVLSPIFAGVADRWNAHGLLMGLGGIMAGAGLVPVLFDFGEAQIMLAVVLLGIAQAMSISPQLALALRICREEVKIVGQAPVVGIYRLTERVGGAAGPFVVAGLASRLGYQQTMAVVGVAAVFVAVAFSVIFLICGIEPEGEDDADLSMPEGVTS